MPGYANLDDYSFDLGKLEESSDLIIKNRKREAEQLDSEDDGPEDFTLNMEKWMRGTGHFKQGEGPAKDEENDDHDAQEESEFLPQDSSTPTPARSKCASAEKPAATPIRTRNATVEDAADVETPMRLPTPKLQRLNTETKQERAAEEVFDRIAALQAEVERLRDESEKRFAASKLLEAKNAQMQSDNQKLYTRLQDTDDMVQDLRVNSEERSAANKRLLEDKAKAQTDKQKLHERLQDANGLVKELQTENEERIASGKELEEENAQMQADNQKLYDRLQQTNDEVDDLRSEKEKHSAASKRLQDENARLRGDSQQRSESRRRASVSSQAENQSVRADNEGLRAENEDLRQQLQVALSSREKLRKDLAASREAGTVHEAAFKTHLSDLKTQHNTAIASIQASHTTNISFIKNLHETAIATPQTSNATEMRELKQTIDRASNAMLKHDDKVNKETLTRIIAVQKDVSTIRGNDPRELRAKASALTKELRSTKAALVDSKTEVKTLRKQLEERKSVLDTAQQEVQSLQRQLTEQSIAHEATQEQNSSVTEEREAEWRRRIGVLLKERDTMVEERKTLISERKTWKKERETMKKERETMSKVLMQQWGKEECGQQGEKEGKQAYRYKYVKKDQKA